MVLVLNGVLQEDSPPDSRTLFHNHPMYRDSALQLVSIPTKVIGPVGLLYIQQRELAVTAPHDSKNTLFSYHLKVFKRRQNDDDDDEKERKNNNNNNDK